MAKIKLFVSYSQADRKSSWPLARSDHRGRWPHHEAEPDLRRRPSRLDRAINPRPAEW